jgi:GntR family transcriptional regulator
VSIDPRSDRPVYRQVADILREQITTGTLAPGAMLPSEKHLADTYSVGRDAIRHALSVLRGEGLVVTSRGEGTKVRDLAERRPVALEDGQYAIARMPTDPERSALKLTEGVPVVVIYAHDTVRHVFAAHDIYLTK